MPRVPYEMVALEADRLIIRMVIAPTPRQASYYWELYLGYISACGWTDRELDQETLRRIDAAWDNIRRKIWN